MLCGGNMLEKFNRALITSINSLQSNNSSKIGMAYENKSVAVPEKETFKYILEKAKKGNEMAAVLLDEWQRSCKPGNEKEESIIRSINKAVHKFFS
jgi:hypothetical protein